MRRTIIPRLAQWMHQWMIPNAMVIACSGLYAIFLSIYSPFNVNYFFSIGLSISSLLFMLFMLASIFFLQKRNFSFFLKFSGNNEKAIDTPSFVLLLPLLPIVQYICRNQEILSFANSVLIFSVFLFISFLMGYLIPKILSKYSSSRLLISTGTAFTLMITSMASISDLYHWLEIGNMLIQLALFILAIGIIWLLLSQKYKKEFGLIVVIFFIGNFLIQSLLNKPDMPVEANTNPIEENETIKLAAGMEPKVTPDIFLLVYDAYTTQETMLNYGIDNSAQQTFLTDQGFIVYPGVYTVGTPTLSSMNRVLNVSTDFYGNLRRGVSGDGVVQNVLKSIGYQSYGIFENEYIFRGITPTYDHYNPLKFISPPSILLSGILIGEFRFDIGFEKMSHNDYIQSKQSVFNLKNNAPIFMYTHSWLPGHSQNSGDCLENEVGLYKERLLSANDEMVQDVNSIVKNYPDAIIIIAGDHGPYLTKNCVFTGNRYDISEITRVDIQDRFSTFLAIRWPSDGYVKDDITVLQDIFPSVFSYVYKDKDFLQFKIDPTIVDTSAISGVTVNNGLIVGGENNGERLFISQ